MAFTLESEIRGVHHEDGRDYDRNMVFSLVEEDHRDDYDQYNSQLKGSSSSSSSSSVNMNPAPFLTKTYELVDDPLTHHIVSWGEDEATFVVWRTPEFARDILPNYFKHNNFSSFVRQLNTYGFKKIVADRWEFANDYFRKGAKHLLSEIHRRKSPHHQDHHYKQLQLLQPDHHHHHQNVTTVSDRDIVTTLAEDNQRLRRKNLMLLSELAHMKNLYNDIIYFIQNHVKPVHVNSSTTHQHERRHDDPHVRISPQEFSRETNRNMQDAVKLFGVPLAMSRSTTSGPKTSLHAP